MKSEDLFVEDFTEFEGIFDIKNFSTVFPNISLSGNSSGRCGNMDEHYIRVWQTFQWWCEGVLFTGKQSLTEGISKESNSMFMNM